MASSIISEDIRILAAEQFRESVSETTSNTKLYVAIGKVDSWANDSSPDIANSSISTVNSVWNNMLGGKIVTGNDIRHVIPRFNWRANTSFAAFDHCTCSLALYNGNTNFYVMTDEWKVYKCISNNNNAISNTKPTSILTTTPVQTADGYIWKFMYQISASERLRFTTDEFIPVKTLIENDNSLQWQVQQNAVDGAINAIKVTNSGSNYSNANNITVTISGDGSGATATATINSISNTVSSIIMVAQGLNYTYADVTITDSGIGTNAAARAILSPSGGHGSNPLYELGGSYLLLNPRLYGSENDTLLTENEFRQVSIIVDPYIYNTSNVANATAFAQYTTLTINGSSDDFVADEYVYQGPSLANSTFQGRVVEWDSTNSTLYLINSEGTVTTDIINGSNSAATGFVDSVTTPDLEPRSGKILYIDNISPISRDPDQNEDFKIVFKF